MGVIGRRIAGIAAAAVLLAAAAVGLGLLRRYAGEGARSEAEHRVNALREHAHSALLGRAERLESKVVAAAARPELRTLISEPDRPTIEDALRNEAWWGAVRDSFKVFALLVGDPAVDFVAGAPPGQLAADELLREAQKRRVASSMVKVRGLPHLAAAAVVDAPGRRRSAMVLVARPVDDTLLEEVARSAEASVMLSDGARALAGGGAPSEVGDLRALAGHEGTEGIQWPPGGRFAAAAAVVGPGLWLWVRTPDRNPRGAIGGLEIAFGLGAILAAALAVVLGFRRRSAGPDLLADATRQLAETRAVIERLTSASGLEAPRIAGLAPLAGSSPPLSAATVTPLPAVGASSARVGTRFGRYVLLDRLGQGGMGEVYTAVTFGAEGFRRPFVIKRLRAELAHDPAVVSQFIDEAKLGSTLIHSNIIPVFDFGKVGNEYHLAQEYILGRDLGRVVRAHIEREGQPLPAAVALFVAHETLIALEYAHMKKQDSGQPLGLVHRDVSPGNILISALGEVKLFDFGIVKVEGRTTRTQDGIVKGNVGFMAPEQARGLALDARADLFSVGLVVYYCLAGEALYRGSTTYDLLVKAATGPGPEERARIAALPDPAAEVVGRALATEPSARYQTAAEFAAALGPLVASTGPMVARVMDRLFGEDFRREEARFATASNPDDSPGPAPGLGSGGLTHV